MDCMQKCMRPKPSRSHRVRSPNRIRCSFLHGIEPYNIHRQRIKHIFLFNQLAIHTHTQTKYTRTLTRARSPRLASIHHTEFEYIGRWCLWDAYLICRLTCIVYASSSSICTFSRRARSGWPSFCSPSLFAVVILASGSWCSFMCAPPPQLGHTAYVSALS